MRVERAAGIVVVRHGQPGGANLGSGEPARQRTWLKASGVDWEVPVFDWELPVFDWKVAVL